MGRWLARGSVGTLAKSNPKGSVIDEPFWSPDLFVACSELAGVGLANNLEIDGRNPLPLLTQNGTSPHQSFFWVFRNHAALRKGDWKIVREHPSQPWQLFNLSIDLNESKNLAAQQQERLAELTDQFQAYQTKLRQSK